MKKARYNSVVFRVPPLNGYRGAVLRSDSSTNEKYALCPVLYVLLELSFNAASYRSETVSAKPVAP